MAPIDLDRVDEMSWTYPPEGWDREYVFSLVAELRAAREIVEGTRRHTVHDEIACAACLDRLAAYDQAVGS
jgi:hypothetical protein